MAGWTFTYDKRKINVSYQVYHLLNTDEKSEHEVHELQYRSQIFRGKSLEKVVGDLVDFLKRREK